jgi:hypothetical protein
MPFPAERSFNPPLSKTPILGPSSGNPKSFQDPNSVASVGNTIQAMADQAQADTLYDAPPPKKEGFLSAEFRNEIYSPWILRTQGCKKEAFEDTQKGGKTTMIAFLVVLGISALMLSFGVKKNK